jgi:hypothetical protein
MKTSVLFMVGAHTAPQKQNVFLFKTYEKEKGFFTESEVRLSINR